MQLKSLFETGLAPLLPPGVVPRLALAVSGGADSMAMALLAKDYCAARGGAVLALIVDHGLRPGSAQEASLTSSRLNHHGISSHILTLDLEVGPALQARAREARYQALAASALAAGFLYVVLGHHQADQYETVAMRLQRGPGGGEGMARWIARDNAVFLRPMLGIQPDLLRPFLHAQRVEWVEDPSNQLRRFERVRVRQDLTGRAPEGAGERAAREREIADFLACHARLYPEGCAVLAADSVPDAVLGVLLRTIAGRPYAPKQEAISRLAGNLRPATLGGVRITKAGRLGAGWLLAREPAACAPPVPALTAARWDQRFTLLQQAEAGMSFGGLGADAQQFKGYKGLPSLVLQSLPALRNAHGAVVFPVSARFTPKLPMTQRPFQV